jgi:hypothetical protein
MYLLESTSDSTCFMNTCFCYLNCWFCILLRGYSIESNKPPWLYRTCFYCFMILYIGLSPYWHILYLTYTLMYFNVINYVLLGSTSDSTCFMTYVFTVFMFHYQTDMFYILLVLWICGTLNKLNWIESYLLHNKGTESLSTQIGYLVLAINLLKGLPHFLCENVCLPQVSQITMMASVVG